MHTSKESASGLHKAQARAQRSYTPALKVSTLWLQDGWAEPCQSVCMGTEEGPTGMGSWEGSDIPSPERQFYTHPQGKGSPWPAAATWEALAWILSVCPVAHAEWWSLGQDTLLP